MKFLVALSVITLSLGSEVFASELPEWVKPLAKRAVIDNFFEEMKNFSEFYKVQSVDVIESTYESGQPSVEVTVNFDDSKECKGRMFFGNCTQLGNEEQIFCFMAMSDCARKQKIFKIYDI